MKNLNKFALGLTALLMGLGGNAIAASETATVLVNASILPTCKVNLPDNVSVQYSPQWQSGVGKTFKVLCTKGTAYEIGVSDGASNDFSNRVMKFGTNDLAYTLKIDNNSTTVPWSDIGSEGTIQGFGTGAEIMTGFEFIVPMEQYVPAGSYVDELVITFNY